MSNPEPYAQKDGKLYRHKRSFTSGVFRHKDEPIKKGSKRLLTAEGAATVAMKKSIEEAKMPKALAAHYKAVEAKERDKVLSKLASDEVEKLGIDVSFVPKDEDILPADVVKKLEAEWKAQPPLINAFLTEEYGSYALYVEIPGAKIVECKACKNKSIKRVDAAGTVLDGHGEAIGRVLDATQ